MAVESFGRAALTNEPSVRPARLSAAVFVAYWFWIRGSYTAMKKFTGDRELAAGAVRQERQGEFNNLLSSPK